MSQRQLVPSNHQPGVKVPARRLRDAVFAALALALLATGCARAGTDTGARRPGGGATDKTSATGGSDVGPGSSGPAPNPGFGATTLGRCFRMESQQSRASVASGRRVPCSSRHTNVVAYVGFLPRPFTARTPVVQRRTLGRRLCEPAYRRALGGTLADRATSILTWTLFTPSQSQLVHGARWVRCDVLARSGDELVPLPSTRPFLSAGVPEQLRICQDESGTDISCSRPHAYRVAAVYQGTGGYPDASTYTALARDRCKELTRKDGGFWQPPSKDGWASGDRFIRCLTATS